MTHVVTEPCYTCKHRQCVQVCPHECFHEGPTMMFIHPDSCTDCDACTSEFPVGAIFYEDDVPEEWIGYIKLNAEMAPMSPLVELS